MSKTAPTTEPSKTPSLPIAPNSQIQLKLSWATIEPAYQKTLRRFARDIKIDGFRKGKAPLHLVEGMVKQDALVEHVLQQVLPDAYAAAIKAEDKHPISQPEIDPVKIEKNSDWELIAYFAETPEISLKKYEDAVKKGAKVGEDEISKQQKALQEKATSEEKSTDKKGKADAPAPTEKTPTDLTADQKKELKTRYIFKELVESINPQMPELLVRREADREIRRLLDQLDQLKLSVERYLESRKITAEQLRTEYLAAAAASLQLEFILAEIGKAEKITAEEKEVDETLERVFGDKLTDAQRKNAEYRSYIFSTLVKQKIAEHLLSLAEK